MFEIKNNSRKNDFHKKEEKREKRKYTSPRFSPLRVRWCCSFFPFFFFLVSSCPYFVIFILVVSFLLYSVYFILKINSKLHNKKHKLQPYQVVTTSLSRVNSVKTPCFNFAISNLLYIFAGVINQLKQNNIMKGNLLQGTARGRMGDIVAKVVHGKQILSKYQPNVNNPKSPKQMANRAIFAEASKVLAKMKKDLLTLGVKPLYNLYSGASKSLANIVIPYCFEHAKNLTEPDQAKLIGKTKPLLTDGYTGNLFALKVGGDVGMEHLELNNVDGAVIAGKAYFGSDKFIPAENLVMAGLTTRTDTMMPFALVSESDNRQVRQVTPNLPFTEPKSYGFKSEVEDCGEWNFLYEVNLPLIVAGGIQEVNFNDPLKQRGGLGFVFDSLGGVVFAGKISETIA